MRSKLSLAVAVPLLASLFWVGAIWPTPAFAQSFSFPVGSFTSSNVCQNSGSPAPACQVLTNGSPLQPQVVQVNNQNVLRLTSDITVQHGSAWYYLQEPLASGFTVTFQFRINNDDLCANCSYPGDGLALVIQNDPAGTGALGFVGNGQNISYGDNDLPGANEPDEGILNSLAIELDTYQNPDYGDPDNNHIAIQSCGPNNANTLTPNSADHTYVCPDGNPAVLGLGSLPTGMSLHDATGDPTINTITVNYLPPGNCLSNCNNLSVYFNSTLIVQATVDIVQQLNLTSGTGAYLGFTAATGNFVQNNDIISWSFSQWPLAPITINQPVQTTVTNFNYTSNLTATVDYSQSGLPTGDFQGLVMQGTVETITDAQYKTLTDNTPFQGTTCQHQDTGNGNYACVVTVDLCTTPNNQAAAGTNCLSTGANPLINLTQTYNLDPSDKPIVAPGVIMGKDNAISNCGDSDNNTCKGLINIFASISGDTTQSGEHTNNFNSIIIPNEGDLQPSTTVTTTPPLNNGWTNGNFTVNFSSIETVPPNNTNPPSPAPTIASINYSATGANLPSPASGTINGASGSVNVPVTTQGATVFTYAAIDTSGTPETLITNSNGTVSSATPTFTINVDLTPPTLTCTPPPVAWSATDVVVPCTAADTGGSGLVGPSSFSVQTNVPVGTETNNAVIPAVTVKDVAGNVSLPQGPYSFEVDKKPPVISGPTVTPATPTYGQSVTANYSCTDGGSGVVQCGPSGSPTFPATASTGPLNSPADGSTGTYTFTVVAQDAVGNQSAPSSVTYTVSQAKPTLTWPTPAAITYGTALSGTQLDATANVPGTFTYKPPAGTVLTTGTQTLSVTFNPTDTTDYTTATTTTLLTVNQAKPMITWPTPAAITYGTALSGTQLDATANVPGTFVYTPVAGTILKAGNQPLSVAFNPTDSTDYSSVVANTVLVVNKAMPVVTWTTPAAITYGTALSSAQLDATANVPGTFVYTPAGGTILKTGNQRLSVTFNPTDSTDYSSVGANTMLVVNKATPVISWPTPAPITYGTPLSSTQLDATANTPGTFVYTPAASIVLPTGNQVLSVAFTPADSTDYTDATAQVNLLVKQPQSQPLISFQPPYVAFGQVTEGTTPSITVMVSNPGTAPLIIKSIAIAGQNEDNDLFTISNNCTSPVVSGGKCSFQVTLNAAVTKTFYFTLLVTDNVAGSPQQVPLTANIVSGK